MRVLVLTIAGLFMVAAAAASEMPFRGGLHIQTAVVNSDGVSWRITGAFSDTTYIGFDGTDAAVSNLVVCESRLGDVDTFLVTNILSQTATTLLMDIRYLDGLSTNTVPRVGSPTFGGAWICDSGGLAIPLTGFYMAAAGSTYLRDGIAAISLYRLGRHVAGFSNLVDRILEAASTNDLPSIPWGDFGGGGRIEEAPEDGNPYARQDGGWTQVVMSGGVTIASLIAADPTNGHPVALAVVSGLVQQDGANFSGRVVWGNPFNGYPLYASIVNGLVEDDE